MPEKNSGINSLLNPSNTFDGDFYQQEHFFDTPSPANGHSDHEQPPRKRARADSDPYEAEHQVYKEAAGSENTKTERKEPEKQLLEYSIFLVDPIDEFTREVADWLWAFGSAHKESWDVLEIEAKVGMLFPAKYRDGQRFHAPVPIETIIMENSLVRFESTMNKTQFMHYNQLLNSRVEETAAPDYQYAPIKYSHNLLQDTFHTESGEKCRLTTNLKTKQRIAVSKQRLADMNVYSPKRGFDWRLSVSLEHEVPFPSAPPQITRMKDRLSYKHQMVQIDLTQVSMPADRSGEPKKNYEMEIEFQFPKDLMIEAEKEQNGQENNYLEMVQVFLNNIRMLIRNAP